MAEAVREFEEKKQKVQKGAIEGSLADVTIVYALLCPFNAKSAEVEEQPHYGDELAVA